MNSLSQQPAKLVKMHPQSLSLSNYVQGYWRLADWNLDANQRLDFLKQHIELGITSVDHASIYGTPPCESRFGEALKLEPSVRDQIQLISKCGIHLESNQNSDMVSHYTSHQSAIISSVEQSLKRLNVSHLDLLLLHRPDFLLNADDVAAAFDTLKHSGKVLHFGVSNYTPSQFSLLQSRLDYPLATNQVEINPINMQAINDGTLDQLQQLSTRPMAWSVLAGGQLFNEKSEQVTRLRKTLRQVGDEIGASSIDQVAIRWVLELPSAPVIILGSGNLDRIKAGLNAQALTMTREQWYRIWVASKGHNVP